MNSLSQRFLKVSAAFLFLALLLLSICPIAVAQSYEEQMRAALELRREARLAEAEQIYSRILTTSPEDADALVGRGFCLLRHKDFFGQAEADFLKVIEIAPPYVDAYYGLALVYKRSGRWDAAKAILEKARDNTGGDVNARNYLADVAWQTGHFPLARTIDDIPAAERARKVKGFQNELYLDYIHDWVENRPDWHQAGLAYVHHLRPDMNAGFSFASYRRNDTDDHQIGLNLNYRQNMNLAFELQSYFSTNRNFLAIQKHHPMVYYSLPSFTVIGVGLRLDEYENGWAKVGRFDIKQYVRAFYGEYTLLTGQDNFDRSVTTHIAKIGYEKEEKFFCHIGYSNGDETVDLYGGSSFSDQLIESVFFNVRYFITKKWGVILAGGPEYRDSELYRTTGALSIFMRF